jgi:hypothetical protein
MAEIHLGSAVDVAEVLAWPTRLEERITFHITRQSEFSLLSEGIAIGRIRELQLSGTLVSVRTTFRIPIVNKGSPVDPSLITLDDPDLGILGGIFGLALVSYAQEVLDSSGDSVQEPLINWLWGKIQEQYGEFGDGKKRQLIFRDPDYSIPQCLRDKNLKSFPYSPQFRRVMAHVGEKLGLGRHGFGDSDSEGALSNFLYEAALNSHEHGRADLNDRAIRGVRGIIFEKLAFDTRDSIDRPRIPAILRPYLYRVIPRKGRVAVVTVADIGPGIHHTLPDRNHESAWEKLDRAFKPGESRKPNGSSAEHGYGLPNLAKAAARLRALLFVQSGELRGLKDFTLLSEKLEDRIQSRGPISLERLCEIDRTRAGTSLSIIWPILSESPDQPELSFMT